MGSSRAAVEAAYGDRAADDAPPGEDVFVVDSIYGGVVFSFEAGVVRSIFIGALAE